MNTTATHCRTNCCGGYILLPVIFIIIIIAAIAYMMNREGIINTALVATKHESETLDYVTRSGIEHALWRVSRQGCSIGSSSSSHPLDTHGYTMTITGTAGSTSNYVLDVDLDAWIDSANPGTVNGAGSSLQSRNQAGVIERPLLRYDLSPLPAGSEILSATAWFYITQASSAGPTRIQRVTADWDESNATWNTMNANMDDSVLATMPLQDTAGTWIQVNLTPQVQAWVNGQPNYGIALNAPGENAVDAFSSREAAARQPYLDVVTGSNAGTQVDITVTGTLDNGISGSLQRSAVTLFQQPPGHAHAQAAAMEGRDTMISSSSPSNNYGISTDLDVSGNASGPVDTALIRFSTRHIPTQAKIVSATLDLYQNSNATTGGEVAIHQVNQSWDEGNLDGTPGATATWNDRLAGTAWNSAGGDYGASSIDTTAIAAHTRAHYQWDATTLVQRWVDGDTDNNGLAVVAAGIADARFSSSDDADPAEHPRLTVTYLCQCDQVCLPPQDSGNIVMVAGYTAGVLRAEDQRKLDQLENWGYTVTTTDDDALAGAGLDSYDAIYVSATASDTSIGGGLVSQGNGIVFELESISDELGLSSTAATPTAGGIDINDTSHDITLPFRTITHALRDSDGALLTATGSIAPGADILADIGGNSSLLAVDIGAGLDGGGIASGRRVMLPLTCSSLEGWERFNNNGRLIIQRAIEWAKAGTCNDGEYRDQFNAVAYSNNDGTLNWSTNWNENDPGSSGPANGNVTISGGELLLDDHPNSGGQPGITRTLNLDGATMSTLSFDFRLGPSTDTGSDVAILEVSSDGGGSWTTLEDFSSRPGGDSGSLSFDLAAHQDAGTLLRFRIAAGYGANNEYLAIDNLGVVICGTVGAGGPPPPGACSGTFRDEFGAVSFANSDGTLAWSGAWQEIGESDDAGAGDIQVLNDTGNYQLRIQDNDNGGEGVLRLTNLTGAGSATLTLLRKREGLDNANDYVALYASAGGSGGPWTELDRYRGGSNDPTYQAESYDLGPYLSATTAIRLLGSGNLGNNDRVWFDDIQIQCAP